MDLCSYFNLSYEERMKEIRSTRCKESWDIRPDSVQDIGEVPDEESEQIIH